MHEIQLSVGQPKVNRVKNFLTLLKLMKRPQTRFHADTTRASEVLRSKKSEFIVMLNIL